MVELSWLPTTDADYGLAGYRLYRRSTTGWTWTQLTEFTDLNRESYTYTDSDLPALPAGGGLVYAVTALDLAGNESDKDASGVTATVIKPGGAAQVTLTLPNAGYARPWLTANGRLTLRNSDSGRSHVFIVSQAEDVETYTFPEMEPESYTLTLTMAGKTAKTETATVIQTTDAYDPTLILPIPEGFMDEIRPDPALLSAGRYSLLALRGYNVQLAIKIAKGIYHAAKKTGQAGKQGVQAVKKTSAEAAQRMNQFNQKYDPLARKIENGVGQGAEAIGPYATAEGVAGAFGMAMEDMPDWFPDMPLEAQLEYIQFRRSFAGITIGETILGLSGIGAVGTFLFDHLWKNRKEAEISTKWERIGMVSIQGAALDSAIANPAYLKLRFDKPVRAEDVESLLQVNGGSVSGKVTAIDAGATAPGIKQASGGENVAQGVRVARTFRVAVAGLSLGDRVALTAPVGIRTYNGVIAESIDLTVEVKEKTDPITAIRYTGSTEELTPRSDPEPVRRAGVSGHRGNAGVDLPDPRPDRRYRRRRCDRQDHPNRGHRHPSGRCGGQRHSDRHFDPGGSGEGDRRTRARVARVGALRRRR